jgi:hypothetical protein
MLNNIKVMKIKQTIKLLYLYFILFQLIKIHIGVKKNVNNKNNNEILSIPITKWKLNKNSHWLYNWKLKTSKSEKRLKLSAKIQNSKTIINWNTENDNEIFFISLVFNTELVIQNDKTSKIANQSKNEKNSK